MTTVINKIAAILGTTLCLATTVWAAPPRVDAYGDPLPPGALLRLGTVRWRACSRYLAFTPDGNTLITEEFTPPDSLIRCWDAATGTERAHFRVPSVVGPFVISPDGKMLAVDATQKSQAILLLSVPDGKEIRRFAVPDVPKGAKFYFLGLDFSPDCKTLAAVDFKGAVQILDVETGKALRRLTAHAAGFCDTNFSPDGKKLAVAGKDHMLRIVDVASDKEVFKQPFHLDSFAPPPSVSFSPDNKKIVWMGEDEATFAVSDLASNQAVLQFRGAPGRVEAVRYSPDGKIIAAVHTDEAGSVIRLWDAETGKQLRKLTIPCRAASALAFSPDGKRLAAADRNDGVVHLWDVKTGKELNRIGEQQGVVDSVGFSPDGRTAYTGCADQVVRVWDVSNGAVLRRVGVGGGGPIFYHIALSNDRSTAAVTDYRMKDYIWDLNTEKRRAELKDGQNNILEPVFTPDGTAVASRVPLGSGIRIWDAKSGKPTAWIAIDDDWLGSFSFSPDGKTIAVERESGPPGGERIIEMRLWDVALNKELRRWLLPNRTRHQLGFAPDGSTIAGAEDNAVDLWDAATGKELLTLRGPKDDPAPGWLTCLAFSQNGRTLAAAGDNGVICLWEVGVAKVRAVLAGHRAKVTSLDFSPDGSRLISGSRDTTAIIWDVANFVKKIEPELPDPRRNPKE